MRNYFRLKERGTSIKTEFVAGATTFLSMAYILAVNPAILAETGMDFNMVFTATAISAAIATLFMAVIADYPIALASGMGLNAYFAYTICGELATKGIQTPWKIALAAVFIEGVFFILLSLVEFREKLINHVPGCLKHSITTGIGLFVALIGLVNAGVVIGSKPTLFTLGNPMSISFSLTMVGLFTIAILHHFKIYGNVLIGMLVSWGIGIISQLLGIYKIDPSHKAFSLIPNFASSNMVPSMPVLFDFNFSWIIENMASFAVIVFSLLFVDIFDTVGGLIGIGEKGKFFDEKGQLPRAKKALLADAFGTVTGACLGTSTVTSFIESTTGIEAGGRTGLSSVFTSLFFLISLFLAPIFIAIPSFATAPALIWVGLMMMSSFKHLQFNGDIADSLGSFIAIVLMPFTMSISNGIMFSILAWVLLKVITGKANDVKPIMWLASLLFAIRVATLV